MGGSARITALAGGSGTNQLIFQLTDFVLPDDDFSLAYWSETGDAAVSAGELGSVDEVAVENRATDYHGSSTRYYVSGSTGAWLIEYINDTEKMRMNLRGESQALKLAR